MKNKICLFLISLLFAMTGLNAAMQAGDAMPAITVKDQHEIDYTLEAGVRYLLVSFDMPTGKAANKFLDSKGAAYLPEHQAVYLSNIHGMPWIGRKFAIPKMQKYPHRILLADEPEESLLAQFPQKDRQVTVFQLDPSLKIVSVSFWDPDTKTSPFSD